MQNLVTFGLSKTLGGFLGVNMGKKCKLSLFLFMSRHKYFKLIFSYVRLARNRDNHCGVATIPSYPIISTIL